jgi:hypothetical protein
MAISTTPAGSPGMSIGELLMPYGPYGLSIPVLPQQLTPPSLRRAHVVS